MKRKLGELLIELGALQEHQLQAALQHQKRFQNKLKLGASLVSLGFITEEKLTEVLARYLNMPLVQLSLEFISPDVVELVATDVAEQFQIMPFKLFEENRKKILGLAMADPTNLEPIDIIQFSTGLNIRPFVAAPSDVDRAIQRYYHGILVEGISYVGTAAGLRTAGEESKIKIISRGNEFTFNAHVGDKGHEPAEGAVRENTPAGSQRVVTERAQGSEQQEALKEVLHHLRESNALMRALIRKGIISEEDVNRELDEK